MTKPLVPPLYTPAHLSAIKRARAELYQAQAERRAGYLSTGKWAPPKARETSPVQAARQNLDAARKAALPVAVPKDAKDADV